MEKSCNRSTITGGGDLINCLSNTQPRIEESIEQLKQKHADMEAPYEAYREKLQQVKTLSKEHRRTGGTVSDMHFWSAQRYVTTALKNHPEYCEIVTTAAILSYVLSGVLTNEPKYIESTLLSSLIDALSDQPLSIMQRTWLLCVLKIKLYQIQEASKPSAKPLYEPQEDGRGPQVPLKLEDMDLNMTRCCDIIRMEETRNFNVSETFLQKEVILEMDGEPDDAPEIPHQTCIYLIPNVVLDILTSTLMSFVDGTVASKVAPIKMLEYKLCNSTAVIIDATLSEITHETPCAKFTVRQSLAMDVTDQFKFFSTTQIFLSNEVHNFVTIDIKKEFDSVPEGNYFLHSYKSRNSIFVVKSFDHAIINAAYDVVRKNVEIGFPDSESEDDDATVINGPQKRQNGQLTPANQKKIKP
nr:hypothetical protein MmNV_20 [Menippe mercenaria nudivirus]